MNGQAFALYPLTAALLPVNGCQDSQNLRSGLAQCRAGLESRTPRRDYVLDHHDALARLETTFDSAAASVLFGLFSDRERVYGLAAPPALAGDGIGDRIGSHRQAADDIRAEIGGEQRIQAYDPHQRLALGMHGRGAAIHVEAAVLPGREHEVTLPKRALSKQSAKPLSGLGTVLAHGLVSGAQAKHTP